MLLKDIKKFIINLPHRKDRLERVKSEMKNHNIDNWEIFPAIHNKTMGFKGLSDTVKKIIRIAKKDNLDMIIIFEDDVKMTNPKSFEKFQLALDSLPEKWDILLGGVYSLLTGYEEYNEHLIKVRDFASLHCTLINKSAYDIILKHDVEKKKHLDRYLGLNCKNGDLKVFLTWPMIAVQYNGESDISNKKVNYDRLLKKFKLY